MNHTLRNLLLFFLASSAAAPPIPPPPAISCSDELVTFSTCLSYVAMSPNNITDSPSPQCCDDISAAFTKGGAVCLCYIIRRPNILGFPLNSTKLMDLTSLCPLKEENSSAVTFSLQTLCSGSTALPPLHSITGGNGPSTSNATGPPPPNATGPPPPNASSPPSPIIDPSQDHSGSLLTPEPSEELPTQPSLSTISSTSENVDKHSWTLLIFLVCTITFT